MILRNAINEHYKSYFNDSDWIRRQLAPGGMLSQHPQKSVVDKTIADLTAAGRYTNDRVVSSVTFGFWTYLFTKKPFRLGGQSLLKIFPAKAPALQKLTMTSLSVTSIFSVILKNIYTSFLMSILPDSVLERIDRL